MGVNTYTDIKGNPGPEYVNLDFETNMISFPE